MALSRSERFKLKSDILFEFSVDNSPWDYRRQNLLLSEFGLETMGDSWGGPNFEDIIAAVPDADLLEMYKVVVGQEADLEAVEMAGPGNWNTGYVRLFISHSAHHKQFIADVASELAVVGIHGFVAHDSMTVTKPWQAQMEQALRSMQAFVAIVHPEFLTSAWCQQEVGWALGRKVPHFAVRMGADPVGFIGHEQWPSASGADATTVAAHISAWASSIPDLSETMTDGLFTALEAANNYMDAGATGSRIATLSNLTDDQWRRLGEIFWANDQVHGGVLATRALEPFYLRHQKAWPPPRPQATQPTDPWSTVG